MLVSIEALPTVALKPPTAFRLFVREAAEFLMEVVTEEAVAEDVTRKETLTADEADS